MPILHDILGRLPKLPVRKPPRDNVPTENAATNSGNGTAPVNFQQPSTPPTTLGPGQAPTIPVQIPVAGQPSPTVIPISVDSGSQGIQLRLSDHLSSQQAVSMPQPQPNFLITQLPTQPTTGNNLLQALLQNQR